MPNGDGWTMHAAYDYRFGHLGFRIESPSGEHNFIISAVSLFKQCNVHPDELRAFAHMMENGVTMPEGDIEPTRIKTLADTDWRGKIVLDVGGYDGAAAEIARKGGAARAICLDNRQYDHYEAGDPGHWPDVCNKEGVEYITGDFMDWTIPVDIAVFFNVLYHLKNPWAALVHLRTLVKPGGEMLLCTLFRFSERSDWYLYEPRECNPKDETVFWGPSVSGLEKLLRLTGWTFKQTGIAMDRAVYRCWPRPNFRDELVEKGLARA